MAKSMKHVVLSKLLHTGIINQGEFILKSGAKSNIYLHFRRLISFPHLFNYLSILVDELFPNLFVFEGSQLDKTVSGNATSAQNAVESEPASQDPTGLGGATTTATNETNAAGNSTPLVRLLPVPFGGIPFGTHLAFQKQLPFLLVRDKPKDHGLGKIVEGIWEELDEVVIIEDVISTGKSVRETLANLEKHGAGNMKFKAILTICNRGCVSFVNGIPVLSLFTLEEIMAFLGEDLTTLDYFTHASSKANALYGQALQHKSNIILSCDFMNTDQILDVVSKAGPFIVAVKLHPDTVISTSANNMEAFHSKLHDLLHTHRLQLIDDAKMADIEAIEVEKARTMVALHVDAVTIHAVAGMSVLDTPVIEVPDFIVVAEMSCKGNMLTPDYARQVISGVRESKSKQHVYGFVCQDLIPSLLSHPFEFLTMSPGVQLGQSGASDGRNQQYTDPTRKRLGLFWIVGRGITQSVDVVATTQRYQQHGFRYFVNY